ncbi:MAG: hypothetical protein KDE26_26525 [Bacteroidetes bacterium]|nr:hypothetical protein [Bacteroidota bacterium]
MKILKILSLFAVLSLVLFSCEKETFDILIGEWNTSDGGKITFVADNTGSTTGSDFFDFGTSDDFTWSLRDSAELTLLTITFMDSNFTGSLETPIEVIKKNEIYVGIEQFDLNVTLTR